MPEIELDPELLADFVVESRELIEDFSSSLIELEKNPEATEIISSIFRVAHTLKGSSAFFNLVHIKNFSHKLENLLDKMRNRELRVTPDVIDILLAGCDHLRDMFNRVQSGDLRSYLTPEEDQFIENLLPYVEAGEISKESSLDDIIQRLEDIIDLYKTEGREAESVILDIESFLASYSSRPEPEKQSTPEKPEAQGSQVISKVYLFKNIDLTIPVEKALNAIARNGENEAFDEEAFEEALVELANLAHENKLEPLLEPIEAALDDFRSVKESAIDFDALIIKLLGEKLEAVIELMETKTKEISGPQKPDTPPGPEQAPVLRKEKKSERKTMRIDEEKVDGFMNFVGELIVTAEAFNYLQKLIENEKVNPQTLRSFKNTNQGFRELSNSLQESLMEIRRVPLKGLLHKVTLMARELAHETGKKVRIAIEDKDVRVDKSILENLEGPIMHLVRNSLDHGLETPADRERSQKPPEGLLQVKAETTKDFFFLDISDDGRGMDPDKIRKSAVRKNMISEEQARELSDQQAINLIFSPGFSTAEKVTDISGRGVGMDVVKTNVTRLNGTVHVDSTPGQGTTFSLKIPLSVTLQVINGLLVKVGSEKFIISIDDIVESLRPKPKEISTIKGQGEIVSRRGGIFPIIRLYDLLGLKTDVTDPAQAILVMVETSHGCSCLLVDEIVGQQQVVVKDLGPQFEGLDFIAGSATLGEGRLSLVLDTEGLINMAGKRRSGTS